MFEKLAAHFRLLREKLLDLRDAPHALAGGVAIGMFIGFTPLFGLKTLLCIVLHEVPPAPPSMHFHIHEVMQWKTFLDMGLPMLLGSIFLCTPAALISYWLALPVFKRRALRRES